MFIVWKHKHEHLPHCLLVRAVQNIVIFLALNIAEKCLKQKIVVAMETEVKNRKICTFDHLSTEVKNGQNFKKIYFFYFQLILTLSDNDS